MSAAPRFDDLRASILSLPTAERAALADELLGSLDEEDPAAVEAAWMEEVADRVAEAERGEAVFIPADEVMVALRRIARGST